MFVLYNKLQKIPALQNNRTPMKEKLENINQEIRSKLKSVSNIKDLVDIRNTYLSKKGLFSEIMKELDQVSKEEKPQLGQIINKAKQEAIELLKNKQIELDKEIINQKLKQEAIDVTLPASNDSNGSLHPITKTAIKITNYFNRIGFTSVKGAEIENQFYNFDALNIPQNHPARSEQDTFYINPELLLRTQTSSVQIRTMLNTKPPLRIISHGKVYRNDYDQTHTPMFHQLEGLMIDKNVSFAQLKGVIHEFLNHFFEKKVETRFRPSYFPFTEPSAEVDIKTEDGKWLEVLGCGIVHPNVLKQVNIDSDQYSGFAFGLGLERLAMLRYEVKDLRLFFENDIRFLKQFK